MTDSSDALKELGQALRKVLDQLEVDRSSPHPSAAQKAAQLAGILQRRGRELQTPQERKQQTELDRMIHHAQDKATLLQMTDQAFRAQTPRRAVDQLVHILDVQGVPRFFSPFDRTMLKGFQSFGAYLPGVAVPLVKEKMHKETANVILPAETELLAEHLDRRREEGVRMNVNYLGEALLGEEDARNRLKGYLQALQRPEMEVISVKISTIYSQISSLAREHSVAQLCDRMELLYRASVRNRFRRADGTEVTKFVYLDMEEYRDMEITAEVFMRTLDRPGLEQVRAGMALQAYVPDSARMQRRINQWARQRVETGGAAVTLRLVKGANMEMERVEASLAGWPQAPYRSKQETDTNYKRMLEAGMKPQNLAAVRVGIASHNLFDISYGLVLAAEAGSVDAVQFEMLEGMANHQRRALFELTRNMLLYAPACRREDFIHAIGYLVRRLDENTGPQNFLRHAFNLEVDSETWHKLEDGFFKCFANMEQVSDAPRRRQDRRKRDESPEDRSMDWRSFVNEPDTDFSLPHNVQWAEALVADWKQRCGEKAAEIPLVIDGAEILEDRDVRQCLDPSRPGMCVGRYRQASAEDIDRAVDCARADADGWRDLEAEERVAILDAVADEIAAARADLMGAALADGGKILGESDAEVSEAVDFARFYARAAHAFGQLPGLAARGRGVVAVVSPWNFPIAIPCGGVAAALAAGNTVILKPASDTVLVAWELCRCFWRAGVSRRALQLVPCSGAGPGQRLVTHAQVDAVVLTGGTETALTMLRARPNMHLLAETGGKNATVVTALADRDQAIKHVLHSAFGHGGQKCSATSLLLLEEELFSDETFRHTLCDAARSLTVGSAWDLPTRVGPLVRPPSGVLE
ncbi:MAG: proline dehydrogenase family protein, partial [Phycisphaerae bacterium]|nr:proline dehydrogenase family protein [Phycisphaerae bacterium]